MNTKQVHLASPLEIRTLGNDACFAIQNWLDHYLCGYDPEMLFDANLSFECMMAALRSSKDLTPFRKILVLAP